MDTFYVGLACLKCQPTIKFNSSNQHHVIKHIGSHILHDASVDYSSKLCGLCPCPTSLCKIVLKKAKGRMGKLAINMEPSFSLNLIKFSIANVAAYFKTSPCTNHPMRCPYCPKLNPAVWSYNFCHHLLRSHPSINLSVHKSLWTPSKLEKDRMRHIWQHQYKQSKPH